MTNKKIQVLLILSLIMVLPLSGQELLSSMLSETGEESGGKLNIGGYTRGTIFTGWNQEDKADIKSAFSETALKVNARPQKVGNAFADIRFRTGYLNGEQVTVLDIKEAYADIYLGKFELRFGKQIKSWGRADVFNPTNNLTPYDYFLRSPQEDDKKLGNFIISGKYSPSNFIRLEFDWVPYYSPSIYRFDLLDLPDFVYFTEGEVPDKTLSNSSYGIKADLLLNKFEGSVSYFYGFDPFRGLVPGILPSPPFADFKIQLLPSPFKQTILGGDLAFNIGSFGIRGELAWKKPKKDNGNPSIPMEEFMWVIGVDRSYGQFRLIMEYYGKSMRDFSPLEAPDEFDPTMLQDPNIWPFLAGMLDQQIGYYNRILFDQTKEIVHCLLVRPSVSLLHETLELETACMYNFTTEEYMVRPQLSYQLSDGIKLIGGYEYYYGHDNTRFKWIKEVFNGPFGEIRISF